MMTVVIHSIGNYIYDTFKHIFMMDAVNEGDA